MKSINNFNKFTVESWLQVVAFLVLLSMGLKAILDVDRNFDTWVYHFPFAARLWGMIPPDGFVFDGYFESRYHGFGVLGEYLQGLFWFFTGRPESANLAGYFSLILYILFLKRYFNVPFYLSTLGLLAVPIVQIHATSSYIDLPSAIAISVLVMMTYHFYVASKQIRKMDLFIIFIAGFCAANMRLQFTPIVFIILCFTIYQIWRKSFKDNNNSSKKNVFVTVFILMIALPIIFATPAKNLFLYGNPVYPVIVKVAGIELNHREETPAEPSLPGFNLPRPLLWLYSVFEIVPRPLFDGDWSIDQGGSRILGDQFGGYFGAYVLFNSVVFLYLAYRNWSRETKVAAIIIVLMSVVTAFMPSSPRLRYYMYWMIVLVSLNFSLICNLAGTALLPKFVNPRNIGLISGLTLGMVIFCTHAEYVRPLFVPFSVFFERKVDNNLLKQIHEGDKVCIKIPHEQWLFLYSSVFQPPMNYSIKAGESINQCGKWRMLKTEIGL
jgi:hypothetical protein